MNVDQARAFITAQHHAIIATQKADGRPQLSPVVTAIDENGYAVVSTREGAAKTRNLRRNPSASLLVLPDTFFGQWIQIDGPCEVVSLPEAMEGLVNLYRAISGEHPNWDEYREAMASENRVLLRIKLESFGPKS